MKLMRSNPVLTAWTALVLLVLVLSTISHAV